MNGANLGGLLGGAAALFVAIFSVVQFVSSRRGKRDTNRIAERINEFTIMEGTIKTLRDNLGEAQAECDQLRDDLHAARDETRALQSEVTVALANVAILSEHIRQYVAPEVPFPRLRRVTNGG